MPEDPEDFDVAAERARVVEELRQADDVTLIAERHPAPDGNPEHGSNEPGDELGEEG